MRAARGLALSAMLRSGSHASRDVADRITRIAGGASARFGALATVLPREDRDAWALLLAPFLILAVAIAGNQSFQLRHHLEALIARPVPPMVIPSTQTVARTVSALPVDVPAITGSRTGATPPAIGVLALVPAGTDASKIATDTGPGAPLRIATAQTRSGLAPVAATPVRTLAPGSLTAPDPRNLQSRAIPVAAGRAKPSGSPEPLASKVRLASLPDTAAPPLLSLLDPSQFASLAAIEDTPARRRGFASLDDRCVMASATNATTTQPVTAIGKPVTMPASTADFGVRLARAAQTQLSDLVIYDDKYRAISYPLGDVPKLYGVCTDVVIRAYREVGIDLQVAVQRARIGSGDRNIDHRRTETLRRFFAREGRNLPVTSFAEDYLPGDIVTYTRPQNTGTSSRSHIAMVSDVLAPSGRPMILHNRGWGPQLEDGLFVDKITGHYRFDGQSRSPAPKHADVVPPEASATRVSTAKSMPERGVRLRPVKQRRPDLAIPPQPASAQAASGRKRHGSARTVDSSAAGNTAHR